MDEFNIKHQREIDKAFIIRAVICFLLCNFALLTIYVFTGGSLFTSKHLIIFSLCTIPLSILYAHTVERLGSIFGGILWTSKKVSPREQLSADLAKARHSKGKSEFEDALNTINNVLEKDPDFPDALYLKAQILWEGYGRSVESKNLFRRVMQLVSADEPLHVWSSDYIDKITLKDKITIAEFMSDEDKKRYD
jgi:tetratricopeptide (TPR) repeat protein